MDSILQLVRYKVSTLAAMLVNDELSIEGKFEIRKSTTDILFKVDDEKRLLGCHSFEMRDTFKLVKEFFK